MRLKRLINEQNKFLLAKLTQKLSQHQKLAQRNRAIAYSIMTQANKGVFFQKTKWRIANDRN